MLDRLCYIGNMKKKKLPTHINLLAKNIVDQTIEGKLTGNAILPAKEKNPAAVALGRLGGLKGGKARAESLSTKRRKMSFCCHPIGSAGVTFVVPAAMDPHTTKTGGAAFARRIIDSILKIFGQLKTIQPRIIKNSGRSTMDFLLFLTFFIKQVL